MALAHSLKKERVQRAVENNLGTEISKEDPSAIYELQEKLGKVPVSACAAPSAYTCAQGSYGSVFLGRQLKNSEMVAVKVISIDDPQTLEDVRREIRILSECNHPNIVKYYGSYFKDQNLWVRRCTVRPMPIFTDCDGVLRRRLCVRHYGHFGCAAPRRADCIHLPRGSKRPTVCITYAALQCAKRPADTYTRCTRYTET